jgi:uncharacterized surface protein with fasciclin (FAS1) repeats
MTAPHTLRRTAAATLAVATASLALTAAHTSATTVPPGDAPVGDCAWVDPAAVADLPVHEAAAELDELSTFMAAIAASSLDEQLAGDGPFTILAPSNAAMSEIPTNVLDSMLADPDLLDSVLGYHVVVGEALSPENLAAAGTVQTLNGPVAVALAGDTLQLNGGEATVTCSGIVTADATVYVIDHVLQPADSMAGCPGGSSVPGTSTPEGSVPTSSVPDSSTPGSSVPGSSVPC